MFKKSSTLLAASFPVETEYVSGILWRRIFTAITAASAPLCEIIAAPGACVPVAAEYNKR